jgi:predicted acyl esterase
MMGNSALAMCQWRIAAEQPPHLTCIAPWEGIADIYREALPWGGFPESGFWPFLANLLEGKNLIEDLAANYERYPLINAYWEDKIPDFSKIEVPAYVTAGWSHFHLRAAIMGFRRISSKMKWLRAATSSGRISTQAGPQEATMFFDRYLKGIRNGWEQTPGPHRRHGRLRLRLSTAARRERVPAGANRIQETLPRRGQPLALYDPGRRGIELSLPRGQRKGDVRHHLRRGDRAHRLHEAAPLGGGRRQRRHGPVRRHPQTGRQRQMAALSGIGQAASRLPGQTRVSLREVDEKHPHHSEFQPWHPFKNPQKLKPGEIVPVEIEIYPSSRVWHAGEQLQVEVSGHYARIDWFEPFDWNTCNKGLHVIHTGGQYDSYLLVPYVPPKYVAGNTVYR